MGNAGTRTTNSRSLLETCRIETVCRPLLVMTTDAAGLTVFTVTDPKLSEEGLTPTPAWTGTAKNIALARINPRDRHTNRVLCMRWRSFVLDLLERRERGRARRSPLNTFAARRGYELQGSQTTGARVSLGTGASRFLQTQYWPVLFTQRGTTRVTRAHRFSAVAELIAGMPGGGVSPENAGRSAARHSHLPSAYALQFA